MIATAKNSQGVALDMFMRNITSWGEKTGKSSSVAFRASSLKQASSFGLFDVDFRLLASCSRLLAVACWLRIGGTGRKAFAISDRIHNSLIHQSLTVNSSACWLPPAGFLLPPTTYWLLPVGSHEIVMHQ